MAIEIMDFSISSGDVPLFSVKVYQRIFICIYMIQYVCIYIYMYNIYIYTYTRTDDISHSYPQSQHPWSHLDASSSEALQVVKRRMEDIDSQLMADTNEAKQVAGTVVKRRGTRTEKAADQNSDRTMRACKMGSFTFADPSL